MSRRWSCITILVAYTSRLQGSLAIDLHLPESCRIFDRGRNVGRQQGVAVWQSLRGQGREESMLEAGARTSDPCRLGHDVVRAWAWDTRGIRVEKGHFCMISGQSIERGL